MKPKKVLFGSSAKKPRQAKVAGSIRTDLATLKNPKPLYGKLGKKRKIKGA